MDRERWRRIEDLYHAARSLPSDACAEFLASECRGDESLRSEVESLIAQPDHTWAGPGSPGSAGDADILGKRVGHYDVQRLLGAGGMGRVYRARDTRLGRDVALKLLPPEWTSDPDRLARLDREARLLASLNHPNIATIHGIEQANGSRALVLEFIEGDTLADRIVRGPLPLPEALAIIRQVKDALDAAHEKGIVHRDLKPANIKVTPAGLVKVLDFGLAMLEPARDGSAPDGSRAPTVTARGTREGIVAGTAAYMSPEQARGLAIDKRTDIWAFGCVLYEMLTGRPPFARATLTDTLAAIVEREPDWTALPSTTPPGVERLLKRCLEKDRRLRLRDIGDASTEPSNVDPVETGRQRTWGWSGAVAGIAIAIAGAAIWVATSDRTPAQTTAMSLTMLPPDGHRLLNNAILSPDGSRVVFTAAAPNERSALWVRTLSDTTARRLAGTDNATRPFWSPDGRAVGFGADGRLKKIDVDAGSVQTICTCVTELLGGTWGSNDVIVFAPFNRAPLLQVSAGGGTPAPASTLNPGRNENSHRWPSFLADGRRFVYTARSDVTGNTGIYLATIDGGQPTWLFEAQSQAMYVPPGRLLFVRERALWMREFDGASGRLAGEAIHVVGAVDQNLTGALGAFSASANGAVLAYQTGLQLARQLVWFDRAGMRRAVVGASDQWEELRLSPDGKRAAVVKRDETASGNRDIWLIELATGLAMRWSSHPANDWRPVWSSTGKHLAFATDRNGASAIFRRPVDGSEDDTQLMLRAAGPAAGRFPDDWSADDILFFDQDSALGPGEILRVAASGKDEPILVRRNAYMNGAARLSPDGRWLAYASNESGNFEIHVSLIDGSNRHQVSTAGGVHPRWRRDGRELVYLAANNAVMSVELKLGSDFEAASPKRLFDSCLTRLPAFYTGGFELANDGSTLWLCPGTESTPGTVTVAIGWSSQLSK